MDIFSSKLSMSYILFLSQEKHRIEYQDKGDWPQHIAYLLITTRIKVICLSMYIAYLVCAPECGTGRRGTVAQPVADKSAR